MTNNIQKVIDILKSEYIVIEKTDSNFQTYMLFSTGEDIYYLEHINTYDESYKISSIHKPSVEHGSSYHIITDNRINALNYILDNIKENVLNFNNPAKKYNDVIDWLNSRYDIDKLKIHYKDKIYTAIEFINYFNEKGK